MTIRFSLVTCNRCSNEIIWTSKSEYMISKGYYPTFFWSTISCCQVMLVNATLQFSTMSRCSIEKWRRQYAFLHQYWSHNAFRFNIGCTECYNKYCVIYLDICGIHTLLKVLGLSLSLSLRVRRKHNRHLRLVFK